MFGFVGLMAKEYSLDMLLDWTVKDAMNLKDVIKASKASKSKTSSVLVDNFVCCKLGSCPKGEKDCVLSYDTGAKLFLHTKKLRCDC
jgi:hypothetical protein